MKIPFTAIILGALTTLAPAQQPPVGSTSNNRNFAVRSGNTFSNVDLTDYDGKILLIMMMTPWCPTCQSTSQAVGDGILDHFSATSRGTLRGKNANGIEIHSILLSTEEAEGWDGVNASFATTNAYEQWGLDANAQRNNPRQNLGYFRGGFIEATDLHDWGNDRRRVVVLNLVRNSASHAYREIVINQNYYSSADNSASRSAINAIQSAPVIIAPSITTHPASTTINNGGTVTLRAAASGTSPKFQWYLGASGITNSPVNGATSANYSTPALTANRTYWVRASNDSGFDDSRAAAITVTPAVTGFPLWQSAYVFPSGKSGVNDDPDNDGIPNLLEYFHGAHPLQNNSQAPFVTFISDTSGRKLVYQRAKNLTGLAVTHQFSSDFANWSNIPNASLGFATRDLGATEEVTVTLPATSATNRFYQIAVETP
jgi:Ig-like domain CHU_C associated